MDKNQGSLTYRYENLVDAILSPVELFSDVYNNHKSYLTNALWDTGAMLSVISPEVVTKLELDTIDTIQIAGINGESTVEVAITSIRFPNGVVIEDVRVAICSMTQENEMIIGMDIIAQMDMAITNGDKKTQFSFIFLRKKVK